MKKMFMVALAIITYNNTTTGDFFDFMNPELEVAEKMSMARKVEEEEAQKIKKINPQYLKNYNILMPIILKDDLKSFQIFFTNNPKFPLTIAPPESTPPFIYMINNGAVNCLKYALDLQLLNLPERYKFLNGQTILDFAKSMAEHNSRAAKSFKALIKYSEAKQQTT